MSRCRADETETATPCDAPNCPTLIVGAPYAWASSEGFEVKVCSEACLHALSAHLLETYRCSLCRKPTSIEDRVPVVNGGVQGHAHAVCQARLSRAIGMQRSALMARRGWGVLGGGRS